MTGRLRRNSNSSSLSVWQLVFSVDSYFLFSARQPDWIDCADVECPGRSWKVSTFLSVWGTAICDLWQRQNPVEPPIIPVPLIEREKGPTTILALRVMNFAWLARETSQTFPL